MASPNRSVEDTQMRDMLARMQADDIAALRNRLVVVKVSRVQYQVLRLGGARLVAGQIVFGAELVFGPAYMEGCEDFVDRELNPEDPHALKSG